MVFGDFLRSGDVSVEVGKVAVLLRVLISYGDVALADGGAVNLFTLEFVVAALDAPAGAGAAISLFALLGDPLFAGYAGGAGVVGATGGLVAKTTADVKVGAALFFVVLNVVEGQCVGSEGEVTCVGAVVFDIGD